jgi:hypothetical protein
MSKSPSRSRGNGSQKPVPNDKKSSMSDIIVGIDITPKSDRSSFIGCLLVLAAMVVLYLGGIYNCGPWLFVAAVFISGCNLPKKVQKVYRYDFKVSVGNKSCSLFGLSSLPEINVSNIGAAFGIDIDQNGCFTDVIYRYEKIKVILTGSLTGSCLLDLECFNNTNGYDNQITKYEIKGNITIASSCGNFRVTIRKDSVPVINRECRPLRD